MLAVLHAASPATLQPYVLACFLAMLPAWGIALMVASEFLRLRRRGRSWLSRARGLSPSELKALVKWCPLWALVLSLSITLLAFVASASTGGAQWHSGEEFTQDHVVGFGLGAMIFCSLALPVLASALAMPGRFADHYSGAGENGI